MGVYSLTNPHEVEPSAGKEVAHGAALKSGSLGSEDSEQSDFVLNRADSVAYETRADGSAESGRWLVGTPFPPIW
jgi:hypothetical protein